MCIRDRLRDGPIRIDLSVGYLADDADKTPNDTDAARMYRAPTGTLFTR